MENRGEGLESWILEFMTDVREKCWWVGVGLYPVSVERRWLV